MYQFKFHRASSLSEAEEAYDAADEPVYLAGGMTMIPTLKMRLAAPSDVVDLSGIDDLVGIFDHPDGVRVAAMTTHNAVAENTLIPVLADLASQIGDAQVRNRGTIGGSIANADPAADYPAAILALNAIIRTTKRSIESDDFFTDFFETALEEGELITAVDFYKPTKAAYAKFPNPASRYAVVGVMVAELESGIRVGVTGACPSAFRFTAAEEALTRDFSVGSLDGLSIDSESCNSDLHASSEYRAHLVTVMAKRAVAQIVG